MANVRRNVGIRGEYLLDRRMAEFKRERPDLGPKPGGPTIRSLKLAVANYVRMNDSEEYKTFRFPQRAKVTSAASLKAPLKGLLSRNDVFALTVTGHPVIAAMPKHSLFPSVTFYTPAGKQLASAVIDEMTQRIQWNVPR